jgi:hypothetical protein
MARSIRRGAVDPGPLPERPVPPCGSGRSCRERLGIEQAYAGDHLEDHPDRVDVRAPVDVGSLFRLLGRHAVSVPITIPVSVVSGAASPANLEIEVEQHVDIARRRLGRGRCPAGSRWTIRRGPRRRRRNSIRVRAASAADPAVRHHLESGAPSSSPGT